MEQKNIVEIRTNSENLAQRRNNKLFSYNERGKLSKEERKVHVCIARFWFNDCNTIVWTVFCLFLAFFSRTRSSNEKTKKFIRKQYRMKIVVKLYKQTIRVGYCWKWSNELFSFLFFLKKKHLFLFEISIFAFGLFRHKNKKREVCNLLNQTKRIINRNTKKKQHYE